MNVRPRTRALPVDGRRVNAGEFDSAGVASLPVC
jgi:hypothetical protein